MRIARTAGAVGLACALAAPLRAQNVFEQARAAFRRDRIDSAYALIQRAAEAEPNRAEVQFWLGQIAGVKAQRSGIPGGFGPARRSKAGYARAVALAPDSLDYLEGLAGYLANAPGIAGGDRDSALVLAERIRRADPRRGAFLVAAVLFRGNDRQKARADSVIEALGRSAAGDRETQLQVANYWTGRQSPSRALPIYERLASRDTTDVMARFGLGRALVMLQREPRRAHGHLWFAAHAPARPADAPGQTPAVGAPWWRLGQSYVQLGLPDSARICFEQALRANPRLRQARQSLDSLTRR